ncbi:hypothetical protein LINPERPRIM_LOCUS25119 [Linum perenne]
MDSISTLPLFSSSKIPPISPWSVNLSTASSPIPSTSPASTASLTLPSEVTPLILLNITCAPFTLSIFQRARFEMWIAIDFR